MSHTPMQRNMKYGFRRRVALWNDIQNFLSPDSVCNRIVTFVTFLKTLCSIPENLDYVKLFLTI